MIQYTGENLPSTSKTELIQHSLIIMHWCSLPATMMYKKNSIVNAQVLWTVLAFLSFLSSIIAPPFGCGKTGHSLMLARGIGSSYFTSACVELPRLTS